MTSEQVETPSPMSVGRRVALTLLVAVAGVGVGLWSMLGIGPLALVVPFVYGGSAYVCVVYGRSGDLPAPAREVCAVVLGVLSGFGTWATMTLIGIMTAVLPFITYRSEDYPYQDEWEAGSIFISLLAAMALWWLLRRSTPAVQPLMPSE